jgi:hypothetical protein
VRLCQVFVPELMSWPCGIWNHYDLTPVQVPDAKGERGLGLRIDKSVSSGVDAKATGTRCL